MNSVTCEHRNGLCLLKIANPPVNAISPDVVAGLARALDSFDQDQAAAALVVYCEGKTFVAGGDIASFEAEDFSTRPFNTLLARIEAYGRPVVAAMHGTVLGGGLELALACHHRVARADTRFGLPEVKLGLLPGSLGTQRLPRLAGVALALDLMLSGRFISAQDALAADIIDEVGEDDPLALGMAAARRFVGEKLGLRRASTLRVKTDAASAEALARAAADAAQKPSAPALAAIVRAVRAAVDLPFDQGEQVEAAEFERLRLSGESKALRHQFFAERRRARHTG